MSEAKSEWESNINRWEYHLDYIRRSDSISEEQKSEVFEGISKLRDVFDDNWLLKAVETKHPLLSSILNYAPLSLLSLSDLGKKLALLKDAPRFDKLTIRLKNRDEYAGAEAELDTAYKLKAAGLRIEELFPKVGRGKSDIRVLVNGEEVYFEVATLQDSIKSARASETHQSLTFPFTFESDVIVQCQIHKILSKPHINELKTKIEKAISSVKHTGDFAHISEPGVIDYLILHRDRQGQLQELVNRFGMKREISGPPVPIDDERRVENKIWQEVGQLPEEKPGVIVIYCNLIYFGEARKYYSELAYQIEEAIYDQPNVLLGVIINRMGSSEKSLLVEEPNYALAMKEIHGILQESVLIIKNRYPNFRLKTETKNKLSSAFLSSA